GLALAWDRLPQFERCVLRDQTRNVCSCWMPALTRIKSTPSPLARRLPALGAIGPASSIGEVDVREDGPPWRPTYGTGQEGGHSWNEDVFDRNGRLANHPVVRRTLQFRQKPREYSSKPTSAGRQFSFQGPVLSPFSPQPISSQPATSPLQR